MDSKGGRPRNFPPETELSTIKLTLPKETVDYSRDFASRVYDGNLPRFVHECIMAMTGKTSSGTMIEVQESRKKIRHLESENRSLASQVRKLEQTADFRRRKIQHLNRAIMVLSHYLRDQYKKDPEQLLKESPEMQEALRQDPTLAPGYRSAYKEAVSQRLLRLLRKHPDIPESTIREDLVGVEMPEVGGYRILGKLLKSLLRVHVSKRVILRKGAGERGDPFLYSVNPSVELSEPAAPAPADENPFRERARERARKAEEESHERIRGELLNYIRWDIWVPEDGLLGMSSLRKEGSPRILQVLAAMVSSGEIRFRSDMGDGETRGYMRPRAQQ